jgi:hypothetical protein
VVLGTCLLVPLAGLLLVLLPLQGVLTGLPGQPWP